MQSYFSDPSILSLVLATKHLLWVILPDADFEISLDIFIRCLGPFYTWLKLNGFNARKFRELILCSQPINTSAYAYTKEETINECNPCFTAMIQFSPLVPRIALSLIRALPWGSFFFFWIIAPNPISALST